MNASVKVAEIDDERFWVAFNALYIQNDPNVVCSETPPPGVAADDWARVVASRQYLLSLDPEVQARVMVDYAEAKDDPAAWQFIAAVMDDYLQHDRMPPLTLLKGLNDGFRRWRGGESIAVVFGEKRGESLNHRRPDGLTKLAWKRTNASLMDYWLARMDGNEDRAAARVVEFRAAPLGGGEAESISTIKRDWKRFGKFKK